MCDHESVMAPLSELPSQQYLNIIQTRWKHSALSAGTA